MAEAARKKRPWTERFTMGLAGDLPDRAVPGPLKQAQLALAAPAESIRRGVGDFLTADSLPGDYLVPGGPMVGAMFRKQLGNLVKDPVRTGMEMTGYPAARRSIDAGRLALESEDPIEGAGRATRALGEGGLALAQVAGNAYGIGSNVTKLYRGKTPVATMPDADMAAVQSRAAKAQTAGPTQLQEMIDDAGARADAAYAKIKPVNYPKAQPVRAARRQRREPQDAYTPYEISPEDQALLAQRAQYLKQNAAEDDQILRLALAAEDEAPAVAAPAPREGQGVTLSANGANIGGNPRGKRAAVGLEKKSDPFWDDRLTSSENKAVEMAKNNYLLFEIADEMDSSVASVKSLISKARRKGVEVPRLPKPAPKAQAVHDLEGKGLSADQIAERMKARGLDVIGGTTPKGRNRAAKNVSKERSALRAAGRIGQAAARGSLPLGMVYLQGRATQETLRENGYQMGLQ